VSAYAKINLTFEVLGTRPDGLHEVATVMQTISLADRLRFGRGSEVTLRHRGLRPSGEDDLILRAAALFRSRANVSSGCAIECAKRIPIAAGLGGGSADAAATLRALDLLLEAGLGGTELAALGAELGADVPFLIEGGTALGTGTGGTIAPLPDAPPHWVVLIAIASGDTRKTAEMYGRLGANDIGDGATARRQVEAVRRGTLDYGAVGSAFNRAAADRWPQTAAALRALRAADAAAASVSGAGPSVFGLYEKRAVALGALASLRAAGCQARLYRFTSRAPLPSREQRR
jgi:4-diphosphocytidyl-2-C-methyl-D-erythritol kinase